jgi:hypothetical protein
MRIETLFSDFRKFIDMVTFKSRCGPDSTFGFRSRIVIRPENNIVIFHDSSTGPTFDFGHSKGRFIGVFDQKTAGWLILPERTEQILIPRFL